MEKVWDEYNFDDYDDEPDDLTLNIGKNFGRHFGKFVTISKV